jgi:hypothetical protein
MANDNTPPKGKKFFSSATLKSSFQGVTGGIYGAIGEDPNMGIQAAGYIFDRAEQTTNAAVKKVKKAFGS